LLGGSGALAQLEDLFRRALLVLRPFRVLPYRKRWAGTSMRCWGLVHEHQVCLTAALESLDLPKGEVTRSCRALDYAQHSLILPLHGKVGNILGELVKNRLFEEMRFCICWGVGGFVQRYFEGKNSIPKAVDINFSACPPSSSVSV
jgi:hypothetical protein